MRTILSILLFVVVSCPLLSQGDARANEGHCSDGILQSIENARIAQGPQQTVALSRVAPHSPMTLSLTGFEAVGVQREEDQWWVVPIGSLGEHDGTRIEANRGLWVLPVDAASGDSSWYFELHDGTAAVTKEDAGLKVQLEADRLPFTNRKLVRTAMLFATDSLFRYHAEQSWRMLWRGFIGELFCLR